MNDTKTEQKLIQTCIRAKTALRAYQNTIDILNDETDLQNCITDMLHLYFSYKCAQLSMHITEEMEGLLRYTVERFNKECIENGMKRDPLARAYLALCNVCQFRS